jgi:hypothetical protein
MALPNHPCIHIKTTIGIYAVIWLAATLMLIACGNGSGSGNNASESAPSQGPVVTIDSTTGGDTNPICGPGTSSGTVQQPTFVRNIPGQTGWYASPLVTDLDGDGTREIIAAYYTLYVYDAAGNRLDSATGNGSRIYAPHAVCDLDGDHVMEIVCGQGHEVYVYEWRNGLHLKQGWPADTTCAGESPEIRGMAVDDLDGDGRLEIVVTTTQTQSAEDGGAQVFVFNSDGGLYQPADATFQACWPRYNNRTGPGGDADRNGAGHEGFGCYGLNVATGNIDDDPQKEIIVTYDNHHIQAFNHDGQAIDAAGYFTNRNSNYRGMPLTWGQFIRWADPDVEEDHYHLHTGDWPHPGNQEWLQWTASPPNVADLNGDGRNEVIGIPNIEMQVPYVTQAYGVMVLEGAYGDGSRSAMRLPGWEILPRGGSPIDVDGWYPPSGVPAPVVINIQGDDLPEIVVSLNDGCFYAFEADGAELWHYNYTHGKPIMFASEAAVADLNQDGSPEIVFATYGDPGQHDSGRLIVLAADGSLLYDLPLPNPGHNGNGNGAPAAPTVADLEGDGQLEILVQTFDHGMDIFTVPGSSDTCLLWTTARGGPLRTGRPSGY